MADVPSDLVTIQTSSGPVYHRGRVFNDDGTVIDRSVPTNSDAYVKDGINVPYHTWNARWVDPASLPTTPLVGPKYFVENRLFFAMGQERIPVGNTIEYKPYEGPMSSGPVMRIGGTTGERPDIGLGADWDGIYLGNLLSEASFKPMVAAAAAGFSMPIWLLGEDGKLFNLLKYPKANCNWDHQDAPFPRIPGAPDWQGDQAVRNFWPDGAHWPQLAYFVFIATRDTRFLSIVQACSIFARIQGGAYAELGDGTVVSVASSLQLRQKAWLLRNDLMAWRATKYAEDNGIPLPSECYPLSYFDTLLKNDAKDAARFIADPAMQASRYFPNTSGASFWNMNYMLQVLNLAILFGRAEWDALHTWAFQNLIMRTSGKHGWPMAWPCPYGVCLGPGLPQGREAVGMQPGQEYPDMAAIFDGYAVDNLFAENPQYSTSGFPSRVTWEALKADPTNGGRFVEGSHEYNQSCHSVLTQAMYLHDQGIKDMLTPLPDLPLCFDNMENMMILYAAEHNGAGKYARQGFARNPDVVLREVGAIVQAPPPPTGGNSEPAPAPLPPVTPVSAPPASFMPEIARSGDLVSLNDGTGGKQFIIIGNGKTVVLQEAVRGSFFVVSKTDDGKGFVLSDTHATGQQFVLYGVAAFYGYGERVLMPDPYVWPAEPAPAPEPQPDPAPTPTPTPTPDPAPLVRIDSSKITKAILDRAKAGEKFVVTYRNKDTAALGPLTILGDYK